MCAIVTSGFWSVARAHSIGPVEAVAGAAGLRSEYLIADSGTAGRGGELLGVFCAYKSVKGRTLIDRELYLPKSWTADRARCREAGVPDEVKFATKQVLAQRMPGSCTGCWCARSVGHCRRGLRR
ncbi:transposase [Nocardia sp. NPDC059246]